MGTHEPSWLQRSVVPLFVSRRRLARSPPARPATCAYALDSGGFTELSTHGAWTIPMRQYIDEVRRWSSILGPPDFAAIQDWMCEPFILEKTGLTVLEHQRRSVQSYLDLKAAAPDLPWLPVVQGWEPMQYVDHVEMYLDAGVDLSDQVAFPRGVGIGSVCRRQATVQAADLVRTVTSLGLRLHGFGFKVLGLRQCGSILSSADSLAWSFHARKVGKPKLPECTHKTCTNCYRWAMAWRERVVSTLEET